ncbi:aldehyde dehydrogenase family protein [Spirillospora sp. NPDC047279]|uniref:aldehyde dehydrogenase family protein n=1 Tax=Spirillospora sp. NPDC047279 TaxID=3155478 RepID=UPI0034049ED3
MPDSTPDEVAAACAAAGRAAPELADLDRFPLSERARLLTTIADNLDAYAADLVTLAAEETGLAPDRLRAELARTTGQARLFAEVAASGAFLDVTVDGPVSRMNEPIGPVAVYAAGNFPFAISVAGGDTVAALAAGCPVVLKSHPGHPRTSRGTADLVADALSGAPSGTFAVVSGFEAGRALVTDPAIRAAAFTGSTRGGRALFDLACARPDPIPFYGELGSVNPVVVTRAAVRERGAEIAAGLVAAISTNAGQLCTKPGVVFLPGGHGLDGAIGREAAKVEPHRMLTPAIADAFTADATALSLRLTTLYGTPPAGDPRPVVFTVPAGEVPDDLWEEHFGPAAVIVEYGTEEDLFGVLDTMPGTLTAAVHAEDEDDPLVRRVMSLLRRRAGRIVTNGWPPGVAIGPATHHGGPWPATTAPLHTSMGTAAIRRFLVPVAYQDTPSRLLPPPLREERP